MAIGTRPIAQESLTKDAVLNTAQNCGDYLEPTVRRNRCHRCLPIKQEGGVVSQPVAFFRFPNTASAYRRNLLERRLAVE